MPSIRRFHLVAALVVLALGGAAAGLVLLAEPAPLRLVEAAPPDGASAVPARSRVVLTFNRPLDEATAEAGLVVSPPTEGLVGAAGRRASFTPRRGFEPETDYTVTVSSALRDRGGRPPARPIVLRFRTRAQALVVRGPAGSLARVPVAGGAPSGPAERLAASGAGAFATAATGAVAYVLPAERVLVVEEAGARPLRVDLPRGLEVRDLAFAPTARALLAMGVQGGEGAGVPYLLRLGAGPAALEPFGPRPQRVSAEGGMVIEALIKSLVEIVYGRDTFAFAPDGRAAIVRDRTWDFAVVGLEGGRRASLGPFLAVGDALPGGEGVLVVAIDPADGRLRRQVLVYARDGTTRPISSPDRDSHDPRVSHRGDRVAFAAALPEVPPPDRAFGVEVVDLATGASRRLTDPPAGMQDLAPRWSPDDEWLAFTRGPVGRPETARVWLVRADGSEPRPFVVPAVEARWSP